MGLSTAPHVAVGAGRDVNVCAQLLPVGSNSLCRRCLDERSSCRVLHVQQMDQPSCRAWVLGGCYIAPIMENQMEKTMVNEIVTALILGFGQWSTCTPLASGRACMSSPKD